MGACPPQGPVRGASSGQNCCGGDCWQSRAPLPSPDHAIDDQVDSPEAPGRFEKVPSDAAILPEYVMADTRKYVDGVSGGCADPMHSGRPEFLERSPPCVITQVDASNSPRPRPTVLPHAVCLCFLPLLSLCAVLSIRPWLISVVSFVQDRPWLRLRVRRRLMLLSVALLLPTVSCTTADIVHVNQGLGDDATCATGESACRTIGRGLDVAVANGVVMVAPGTYSGTGNCDVAITRPVTLVSSEGRSKTKWDCEHKSRCLRILANATVEGFTFQRGFVAPIANCSDVDSEHMDDRRRLARAPLNLPRNAKQSGLAPTEGTHTDMTQANTRLGVAQESQKKPGAESSVVAPCSSNAFFALLVPSSVGVTSVPFQSADGRDLERALHRLSTQDFIALRQAVLHIPLVRGQQPQDGYKASWENTTASLVGVANTTTGPMAGASWSKFPDQPTHQHYQDSHSTAGRDSMQIHRDDCKMEHDRRYMPISPILNARQVSSRSIREPQALSARPRSWSAFILESLVASAGGCILIAGGAVDVTIAHSAIIGGTAPHGGGIACNGTNAVVSNVSVTSNNAEWGGGLLAVGGTLQIVGSLISKNTVVNRGPVGTWPINAAVGAGVALFHVEHADVSNSSITRNMGASCGQCDENFNCPESTGGGILGSDSTLSVSSSYVTDNDLTGYLAVGGGISNLGGTIAVSSSHVTSNYLRAADSSFGGGIYSSGGTISMSSSHITLNYLKSEGSYGGGIYSENGIVSVSSSHVTSNYVRSEQRGVGGGIYSFRGDVSVSSSNVTKNSLTCSGGLSSGGGIASNGGNVSVSSSYVTSNYLRSLSSAGGGIYSFGGIVVVSSSHVISNYVSGNRTSGGGIYSFRGMVSVSSSRVTNNSLTCSGSRCQLGGGGIFCWFADLAVSSSHVSSNVLNCIGQACHSQGGGIYSQTGDHGSGGIVSVSSSRVASNCLSGSGSLQGGAIYLSGGKLSLASSNLTENSLHASGGTAAQGGAIWGCCGAFMTARRSNISHNSIWGPYTQGGALWMSRMTSWVQVCDFSHNRLMATFSASGGGIYAVSDVSLEVTASNVSYNLLPSNVSQGAGGGLFLVNCGTHLVGTHVSNNEISGPGGGGGLLVQGSGINSTVRLSDNTMVASNRAQIGGGMFVSGRVHASNIAMVDNSASGQGGAAFLSQEADFVFRGSIAGNTAGSVGSVLFSAQQPSGSTNSTRLHLLGRATVAAGWAVVVNTLSSSQVKMEAYFSCQTGSRMNFTNLVSSQQDTQILEVPCWRNCSAIYGNGRKGPWCCPAWPTQLEIIPSFPSMTFVAIQCNPCDRGRYSLEMGTIHNSNLTNFCRECPFGGDCQGGSKVGAQAGFWGIVRSMQGRDMTFHRCPAGYCCPVSPQHQSNCAFDHCEGNRTGILCGRCPKGTSNVYFSTRCTKDKDCSDAVWAIPLFLIALAFYTAYMVLSPSKASTGLLEVIVYFYQVTTYVRGEAEWRHSSALAVSSIESIFLGGAFGGGGGSSARGVCVVPGMTAAFVTAGNYMVPVLVAFVMALWYGAARLRDRNVPHREQAMPVSWKQSLKLRSATPGVASLVRLLLLSYSSLASTSLRLLVCRTIAGVEGNNWRFFLDASVTCPAPWQLGPFLVFLGLVPLPVVLVRWVHLHREQYPDAAALLQAPLAPGQRHWQAVLLYQRLVLAVLFTAIPEPLWRGMLVAGACVVNLVLAVWFRPWRVVRIQALYVFVLVLLVVLALLVLPGVAKQSLSTQDEFGDNAANAAVLEWLQFLVILTPGCAAVVTLVTTQEPETWLRLRHAWSRLHRNTAGGGVELFPIDAATPQADDTALTQA